MIDLIELRNLSDKELIKELEKAEKEFIRFKLGVKTNQKKENHMLSALRKYIARILTILKEKQLVLVK